MSIAIFIFIFFFWFKNEKFEKQARNEKVNRIRLINCWVVMVMGVINFLKDIQFWVKNRCMNYLIRVQNICSICVWIVYIFFRFFIFLQKKKLLFHNSFAEMCSYTFKSVYLATSHYLYTKFISEKILFVVFFFFF